MKSIQPFQSDQGEKHGPFTLAPRKVFSKSSGWNISASQGEEKEPHAEKGKTRFVSEEGLKDEKMEEELVGTCNTFGCCSKQEHTRVKSSLPTGVLDILF